MGTNSTINRHISGGSICRGFCLFFLGGGQRKFISLLKGKSKLDGSGKEFFPRTLDLGQKSVLNPLHNEAVRRNQGKTIPVLLKAQGLNPGIKLVLRKFLLEVRNTGLPEGVQRWMHS